MKKKVIGTTLIISILIAVIFSVVLYADVGKLYVSLATLDLEGYGYGIGDPTKTSGKYIWDMRTYASDSGSTSNEKKNIYCLISSNKLLFSLITLPASTCELAIKNIFKSFNTGNRIEFSSNN